MSTSTTSGRRRLATIGVLGAAVIGLSGCIMPPPLPEAPTEPSTAPSTAPSEPAEPETSAPSEPSEPAEPEEPSSGAIVEGEIPEGGEGTATFTVDERSAVALGATSPSGGDLALSMRVDDATVTIDDSNSVIEVFSFDPGPLEPTLAVVLDPGEYTVTLTEYGGAAADFIFETHTGTTPVAAGSSAQLELTDGPALAIVTLESGSETLAVTSEFDTVMWAGVLGSGTIYMDDDGGEGLNPQIEIDGEQPQDIAVVIDGYDDDDTGPLTLTVG